MGVSGATEAVLKDLALREVSPSGQTGHVGYMRLKQQWRWGCLETKAQILLLPPSTSASQICSQALEISSNITQGPRPTEGSSGSCRAALPLYSWEA